MCRFISAFSCCLLSCRSISAFACCVKHAQLKERRATAREIHSRKPHLSRAFPPAADTSTSHTELIVQHAVEEEHTQSYERDLLGEGLRHERARLPPGHGLGRDRHRRRAARGWLVSVHALPRALWQGKGAPVRLVWRRVWLGNYKWLTVSMRLCVCVLAEARDGKNGQDRGEWEHRRWRAHEGSYSDSTQCFC